MKRAATQELHFAPEGKIRELSESQFEKEEQGMTTPANE